MHAARTSRIALPTAPPSLRVRSDSLPLRLRSGNISLDLGLFAVEVTADRRTRTRFHTALSHCLATGNTQPRSNPIRVALTTPPPVAAPPPSPLQRVPEQPRSRLGAGSLLEGGEDDSEDETSSSYSDEDEEEDEVAEDALDAFKKRFSSSSSGLDALKRTDSPLRRFSAFLFDEGDDEGGGGGGCDAGGGGAGAGGGGAGEKAERLLNGYHQHHLTVPLQRPPAPAATAPLAAPHPPRLACLQSRESRESR
jgi:hypothetical protein